MIVSIWRYRTAEGCEREFERIYGADGDWAKLFARSLGYLGSELLRTGDGSYLTLDRWQDQASFDAFKSAHGDEYLTLDAACQPLTADEAAIGLFEAVETG
jgi:heme-degrading monooxygenase HmoA